MGFVYVFGTDHGVCKIGRTDGRVEERRKQIQTACPFEITRVWHSEDIPCNEKCERILHGIFAKRKTSGEWFDVPFEECVFTAARVCKENVESENDRLFRIVFDRLEKLEKEVALLKQRRYR